MLQEIVSVVYNGETMELPVWEGDEGATCLDFLRNHGIAIERDVDVYDSRGGLVTHFPISTALPPLYAKPTKGTGTMIRGVNSATSSKPAESATSAASSSFASRKLEQESDEVSHPALFKMLSDVRDRIGELAGRMAHAEKVERYKYVAAVFIAVIAITSVYSAVLQDEAKRQEEEFKTKSIMALNDANTESIKTESIISEDMQKIASAKRYFMTGEELRWYHLRETINNTNITYTQYKGEAIIAYDNAYDLLESTVMLEKRFIVLQWTTNLDSYADFAPWEYSDLQMLRLATDLQDAFDQSERNADAYKSALRAPSEQKRLEAENYTKRAADAGESASQLLRATTLFTVATTLAGISMIPTDEKKLLAIMGVALLIYFSGIVIMAT